MDIALQTRHALDGFVESARTLSDKAILFRRQKEMVIRLVEETVASYSMPLDQTSVWVSVPALPHLVTKKIVPSDGGDQTERWLIQSGETDSAEVRILGDKTWVIFDSRFPNGERHVVDVMVSAISERVRVIHEMWVGDEKTSVTTIPICEFDSNKFSMFFEATA